MLVSTLQRKVVFVGDSQVGKTSLARALCLDQRAVPGQQPTIAFGQYEGNYQRGGLDLKITFWDTGGQERYKSLTPQYLRNANLVFVTFALNERESFENVANWVETARNVESTASIVLIGNKSDLPNRVITQQEINDIVEALTLERYHETSAADGTGIDGLVSGTIDLLTEKRTESLEVIPIVDLIQARTDPEYKCC
jgi:small GTP-binding protein